MRENIQRKQEGERDREGEGEKGRRGEGATPDSALTTHDSRLTTLQPPTNWHRESYDRFVRERLPELLAARLPLAGYRAEATGTYSCRVTVGVAGGEGPVETVYDLPQPDEQGLFEVEGRRYVVIPQASSEDLESAAIRCVGELLYDAVALHLGEAADGLPWDEPLLRAWLPLDAWTRDFLLSASQFDETNWLSRHTHLRRIEVPSRRRGLTPAHYGRVCPLESPENENMGRLLTVAVGAAIRDGKLVILDPRAEAGLGLTASMIPFLENGEPTRLMMGCNQARQKFAPPDPEPALVQTGSEPADREFWCGRNLLTAFIPWGPETLEDAIVISESCARRLAYPAPIETGDKLATRYGNKGTVSRIAPDAEMPHLEDGTPVELVYSFFGIPSRLAMCHVREAVMSRIARKRGEPVIVAPFHAPKPEEIRTMLREAGLPESGMERLRMGPGGPPLDRDSTVGWVYWGKLYETTASQIHTWRERGRAQRQCDLEFFVLRDAGAYETAREHFGLRAVPEREGHALAERMAAGPVKQLAPPSPGFSRLARKLSAAGIRAELADGALRFRLGEPEPDPVRLAAPVPHPWLPERTLDAVGAGGPKELYAAVAEANARLEQLQAGGAPPSLTRRAEEELASRVRRYVSRLLSRDDVRPGGKVLVSGRAVISPSGELAHDQVGLPDEIAWALFGPLAARKAGGSEVEKRSRKAEAALDEAMAGKWVLLNRAPSVMSTSILAYRPVRVPGRVLRVHPTVLPLTNGDFDGDVLAVFLPLTEESQRECATRLSVAAHLARDPGLLLSALPHHDALWGLASLSRKPEGLAEIRELAGAEVAAPEGFITRRSLRDALLPVLEREGAQATLARLDRLIRRGFEVAKRSGASYSPFTGSSLEKPPAPETEDPRAWRRFSEMLEERLAARTDYDDPEMGALLLSIKCGARAIMKQAVWAAGSPGVVLDAAGREAPIRHGMNEGFTPEEFLALTVGMREGLVRFTADAIRTIEGYRESKRSRSFAVLARAMRANHPGFVFAHAAAMEEVDPLTDLDSRLFVGFGA